MICVVLCVCVSVCVCVLIILLSSVTTTGAETGAGGRMRDTHATGTGSIMGAGTAGYCVGNLLLDGAVQPHEDASAVYPDNLASPSQILIDASNGASDYGNKFGEPLVAGYTRTFGARLPDGERREWLKPIMFRWVLTVDVGWGVMQAALHAVMPVMQAQLHGHVDSRIHLGMCSCRYRHSTGTLKHVSLLLYCSAGVGQIDHRHLDKHDGEIGMLVVKIGGPAYRIGMGGGAASSVPSGSSARADLDFNAVQRGDAEMAQKLWRVVRR